MTVHQVEAAVDQGVSERTLLGGNLIAPVASPVDRRNEKVAWPLVSGSRLCEAR